MIPTRTWSALKGKTGTASSQQTSATGLRSRQNVRACQAKIVTIDFFRIFDDSLCAGPADRQCCRELEDGGDHLFLTGMKHYLTSDILRNFRVSSRLHQGGMGCQGTRQYAHLSPRRCNRLKMQSLSLNFVHDLVYFSSSFPITSSITQKDLPAMTLTHALPRSGASKTTTWTPMSGVTLATAS